jgi:hypothetical protein
MKKQRVFREYEDHMGWFIILAVLSFGVVFLWYDWFNETTYFYNRKTLLKILKDKSYSRLELETRWASLPDIDMYILEVEDEVYEVWVWNTPDDKGGVTLGDDLIGLFQGGYLSKRITKQIVKLIEQNATKL